MIDIAAVRDKQCWRVVLRSGESVVTLPTEFPTMNSALWLVSFILRYMAMLEK